MIDDVSKGDEKKMKKKSKRAQYCKKRRGKKEGYKKMKLPLPEACSLRDGVQEVKEPKKNSPGKEKKHGKKRKKYRQLVYNRR